MKFPSLPPARRVILHIRNALAFILDMLPVSVICGHCAYAPGHCPPCKASRIRQHQPWGTAER
ncbi:MAG: hypothetical protein JXB88_24070 [Spirochaetales bacterium]|nr:hypothetical protein [Spirochaetales bacterium]